MLIYTKLIDKMEIKSRINLSTHVSMCTKKKKKYKIRHDSMHITAIPSKLYTCITYTGIWISSNNHKNVRKFTVSIDD